MADEFLTFIRLVVAGKTADVQRRLQASPSLATAAARTGATRGQAPPFFFREIRHYLYQGDTALHMAAAAFQPAIVELLIAHGADVGARNRLGAMPLHYAADTNHWNPDAQTRTIEYLLSIGAEPNAIDGRGVTPLHRAVRMRSSAAVKALLAGGADPRKKNGHGSTPLQLAEWTTGRGGSGTARAREQQAAIIQLLLDG
jgi:hypothetical protein